MIISFLFLIFFFSFLITKVLLFCKKICLIQRELRCLKFIDHVILYIDFFLVENLIKRIKSKIKILYILNMIFKTVIETLKNFSIYLNIFSYFAALQFSN